MGRALFALPRAEDFLLGTYCRYAQQVGHAGSIFGQQEGRVVVYFPAAFALKIHPVSAYFDGGSSGDFAEMEQRDWSPTFVLDHLPVHALAMTSTINIGVVSICRLSFSLIMSGALLERLYAHASC